MNTENPTAISEKENMEPVAQQPLTPQEKYELMPFGKVNFILMGICVLLIIIGFALMSGGGSAVETEFNPEIFSTRRLVVGPTIAFIGFLCMAFAIIWKPRPKK